MRNYNCIGYHIGTAYCDRNVKGTGTVSRFGIQNQRSKIKKRVYGVMKFLLKVILKFFIGLISDIGNLEIVSALGKICVIAIVVFVVMAIIGAIFGD